MAVFTPLTPADADRVCRAHDLGTCQHVQPIAQGSVNSNFFVTTTDARYFLRIYEEQEREGVAYEWALLEHLRAAAVPVPRRVGKVEPGAVRVADKPVALFEVVSGEQSCQALVSPARAAAIGDLLARVHQAGVDFPWRKAGRFELDRVIQRLDGISHEDHPELRDVSLELREVAAEVRATWPSGLPQGVIHGDLFRDNVCWEGDRVVALLDWESASDGLLAYDLMVTVLAWCYADRFRWDLAAPLVTAYAKRRPLPVAERQALRVLGLAAAVRFTVTRITDFHLRPGGIGDRVHKDYRRFHERMRTLRDLTGGELTDRLLA